MRRYTERFIQLDNNIYRIWKFEDEDILHWELTPFKTLP